ncbi:hypothetical protein AB9M62_57295 [Bacillales bacterium AN1005]
MAKVIKSLVLITPSNTSTTAYTTPADKYAIAKSAVICNYGSVDLTFNLTIGNVFVATSHTLKAGNTLALNDLDIPLLPGEVINVGTSSLAITIKVSGFEDDYIANEFPYIKVNASTLNTTAMSVIRDTDVIIRSIIIAAHASGNRICTIEAPLPIVKQSLNAFDSLILSNLQYYISKSEALTYKTDSASYRITFIMEKVVQ